MAEMMKESDNNKTVHLVSQEGESFDVPLPVAKMSELVKTMIDEEQEDDEAQEIPLPNVKSTILAKVIEFCQYYRSNPMNEIEKVHVSTPRHFLPLLISVLIKAIEIR
jgi:S-phase kinase-associated protein 1